MAVFSLLATAALAGVALYLAAALLAFVGLIAFLVACAPFAVLFGKPRSPVMRVEPTFSSVTYNPDPAVEQLKAELKAKFEEELARTAD